MPSLYAMPRGLRDSIAVAPSPALTPSARTTGAPGWRWTCAVFSAAFLFLLALEAGFRRYAPDGLRFQAWNSERMMQTLSLRDLRDEPLRSLWYLHIQPPLLDVFRASLAGLHRSLDEASLVDAVDRWTYVAWAAVFAATAALVFSWLHRLAGWRTALVGTVLWVLHPAAIAFATLLDGTAASAAAFLWFCLEQWRFHRGEGSVPRLAAATLVLFFLRSIFQWPFLVLGVLSLVLLRVPARRVVRYAAVVGLLAGLYVAKQFVLFGTPMTSTFDGMNFCRAIGMGEPDVSELRLPRDIFPGSLPSPTRAAVLREEEKLGGHYNYNQLDYLRYSAALKHVCRQALRSRPLSTTLASFAQNALLYGRPSSRYQPNVLVDRLPWRGAYDFVFSSPVLWLLLLAAGVSAARRLKGAEDWRHTAALVLPILYVAAVSVLFEKGENMRFKYFVEPVLFVFLCSEGARLATRIRLRRPATHRTVGDSAG
ncbi:hypothetical protein [Myxococcus sp. RHSTA-1-4]|uniref:hypothetical protein n=1 Tax=Myxococcus sp. RHSTA-1-4 TaxID=2874601 RepID=UPI001CBE14C9|nr:hypothetical protein [Myxococcus sp. RHSTA-1-4]MBZ4418370.1 hypothetical protein [Myxococcus sp. RHSTA-1-4]